MTMPVLLNTIVSSVVLAAAFSLVTLGYVIVFRASRVFNFAHPYFMLLGTLAYTSLYSFGLRGPVSGLISTIAVSFVGALLYLLIFQRVAGRPHWIQVVLTMGVGIVAVNLIQLVWGTNLRFVSLGLGDQQWRWNGVSLTAIDLAVVCVGVVLSGVCWWLVSVSAMSHRLKAIAENPILAAYSGIDLRFWFAASWAIAAAAAAVGGIAYSSRVPVDANLAGVGLLAFPAAMLGGMDSVGGAFAGAIILAFVQQFAATVWGPDEAAALSFVIVLIVLLFRPNGLFGSRVVERA